MRLVLNEIDGDAIAVIPACCWSIIDGPWPVHALRVPVFHTAFETAAVVAAGIKAAKRRQGRDVTVVAWAGDGGTFDIGLQALSGAAERNEDIVYVCYDNEAYMNTGIQRSSATPLGTWTTTTPNEHPEPRPKKDIMEIMAAHRIPYAATATAAYPDDLRRKVRRAVEEFRGGTRFLHVMAACPPGWKIETERAIDVMRLAVDSGVFPLYEVVDGRDYTITHRPARAVDPEEYFAAQGRFRPLLADPELLATARARIAERWEDLERSADWSAQRLLASSNPSNTASR
jgi:pyruvate ferredoxin oxidoreductase beta subunit/2-oxoisovalerate ferredoxin oxidoreductase beta subunit